MIALEVSLRIGYHPKNISENAGHYHFGMKDDDEESLTILLSIANDFECDIGDICDLVKEVGSEEL